MLQCMSGTVSQFSIAKIGVEETFAMDEHIVSPPQTIDAEQLTALRARLASP